MYTPLDKKSNWRLGIVWDVWDGPQKDCCGNPRKQQISQTLPKDKRLLRIVDDVRTIIQQQNEYIYIPDLRAYTNA